MLPALASYMNFLYITPIIRITKGKVKPVCKKVTDCYHFSSIKKQYDKNRTAFTSYNQLSTPWKKKSITGMVMAHNTVDTTLTTEA